MSVERQALDKYQELYGTKAPEFKCFAPGRVNLIGEHVDYNDGFVLPFALPHRTVIVGDLVHGGGDESDIASCTMDDRVKFNIHAMEKGSPVWANYVKGTFDQYRDFWPKTAGVRMVISSNVPLGSGLSSSASLEVAVATFIESCLNKLGVEFTPRGGVAKALRCQKAEHICALTPCQCSNEDATAC